MGPSSSLLHTPHCPRHDGISCLLEVQAPSSLVVAKFLAGKGRSDTGRVSALQASLAPCLNTNCSRMLRDDVVTLGHRASTPLPHQPRPSPLFLPHLCLWPELEWTLDQASWLVQDDNGVQLRNCNLVRQSWCSQSGEIEAWGKRARTTLWDVRGWPVESTCAASPPLASMAETASHSGLCAMLSPHSTPGWNLLPFLVWDKGLCTGVLDVELCSQILNSL